MERKQSLFKLFENVENKVLIEKLLNDLIFMEDQLIKLRKLPMIKVHPSNPELQKCTPASKLYKETLQQYNNVIRTLSSFIRHDESVEESPLEIYLKNLSKGS